MFGSTIIDVAIGIVLCFMAVSLATSAITEAIGSFLTLREKTLLKGIKALLDDPAFTGIALDLYQHALVNPLGASTVKSATDFVHTPSYIDSKQFALALYSILNDGSNNPEVFIGKITNEHLQKTLRTLWREAANDIETFKKNIATWFDNAMDRLSGWYKRWSQWVSFVVALAIAAILNVNVLYEGAQIWAHPGLVATISSGELSNKIEAFKTCTPAAGSAANPSICSVLDQLQQGYLIGWVKGPMPQDFKALVLALASWLIVAGSALFGASFWFDLLQRLTQLRGTGLVPDKSRDKPPGPPSDPTPAVTP